MPLARRLRRKTGIAARWARDAPAYALARWKRPAKDQVIYLHIGPHKTGTTTAQASFHANRAPLAPYLHIVRRTDSLAEQLCILTRKAGPPDAAMKTQITKATTALAGPLAPHPRILISHEDLMGARPTLRQVQGLYPHGSARLKAIVTALEQTGARVVVLFTHRAYGDWLSSLRRDLAHVHGQTNDIDDTAFAQTHGLPEDGWRPLLDQLRATLGDRLHTLEMADDTARQRMGESVLRTCRVPQPVLDKLTWSAPRRVTQALSPADSASAGDPGP